MDIHKTLKLLQIDGLDIYFQPIFSVGSKKVIGLEALLRGVKDGEVISPLKLFEMAEKKGLKVELDRAARYLAFVLFKNFFVNQGRNDKKTNFYLFFNFDASIIDESCCATWYIHRLVEKCGLSPSQIVIEIIETKVKNFEALKRFVKTYRDLGFLIALDDVGVDYSNLNRIIEIKPDFIKVDRILVKDLAKDEYKCKLIKALANLTKQIGSFILAEGIETEMDLFKTLELGVDFHQGYFLERPVPPEEVMPEKYAEKLQNLNETFTSHYLKGVVSYKKHLYDLYKDVINTFAKRLKKAEPSSFDSLLQKLINSYEFIQTGYVVDTSNKLCTPVLFNQKTITTTFYDRLMPILFKKGDHLPLYPHILYLLSGEYDQFVSEAYIHFLTKKEVCTVSKIFNHKTEGKDYILCLDFLIPSGLKKEKILEIRKELRENQTKLA